VLRRVRDPLSVHELLTRHGLPCPETCAGTPDPRRRWLVKPRRGAAGAGIRPWSPDAAVDAKRCYLQEWIDGDSYAALFVARNGAAELAGVTRQLTGAPWLHAGTFRYCGSVGPIVLPDGCTAALRRLGDVLAGEFALHGLFGVDFVLHDDAPWPVEINPRYTASVEVVERATGRRLLAEHAAAFAGTVDARGAPVLAGELRHLPGEPAGVAGKGRVHGKAILFSAQAFTFPARGPWEAAFEHGLADIDIPFGDVPRAGTPIPAGAPVLTVFACAASLAECIAELGRAAAHVGSFLPMAPADIVL
jgi:predicted ATP-grasp superfamily ATP-dependent carboligase